MEGDVKVERTQIAKDQQAKLRGNSRVSGSCWIGYLCRMGDAPVARVRVGCRFADEGLQKILLPGSRCGTECHRIGQCKIK